MKKKILGLLVMVACVFGMSSVDAAIVNRETGSVISYETATAHQYNGKEFKPASKLTDGDYVLVEGVDFKRTYWTTQDSRLNPQDVEAADETPNFVRPGFVWESLTGIGNYFGQIDNRHTNYIYMGTSPYSYSKYVGEEDPEFKAYDIFWVNGAWVTGDSIEANAVASYDVERVEGEEAGEYTISLTNIALSNPKLVAAAAAYSQKVKDSLASVGSSELNFRLIDRGNGYYMSNGYVRFIPYTSTITIKDFAKVVVNYVDEDGKALADSETIEGKVDEDYKTEAKEIKDYELIKVEGEETGKFTEEEITVTYVYQFVMGQGEEEEEEEIVNTGSKLNVTLMSAVTVIISALSLSLISKKRNN